MKLPDWASKLWSKRNTTTTERSSLEEQKELVDKAERLDRLVEHPGWEDVCRYMVSRVQAAIAEATAHPDDPQKQLTLVTRWDAKRSLLDDTMGWIEGIRKSRDDLVAQFRQGDIDGRS